jgi:hypothetical protein
MYQSESFISYSLFPNKVRKYYHFSLSFPPPKALPYLQLPSYPPNKALTAGFVFVL